MSYRDLLSPETRATLAARELAQSPYRSDNIRCKECDQVFRPCDSTGSDLGLCQNCWEEESGKEWWNAVKDLEPTGVPDHYRRVEVDGGN